MLRRAGARCQALGIVAVQNMTDIGSGQICSYIHSWLHNPLSVLQKCSHHGDTLEQGHFLQPNNPLQQKHIQLFPPL